jgi:hypothetical protein
VTTEEERQFLAYIKAHRQIGYGRMMQMVSHEWYRAAERDIPGTGAIAHIANTCFGLLPERDQQAWLALLEAEEMLGMEY